MTPGQPGPRPRYDEVLTVAGIRIPFDPKVITPLTEAPMRAGTYELAEARELRRILRAGDRVLELGGGVGFLSTIAALSPGIGRVVTVEASPKLIPMIRETHRLNGVTGVEVIAGAAVAEGGGDIDFFLRPHFWGSSLDANLRAYSRAVKRPRIAVAPLIAGLRPSVIVCDIEGGEDGLFDGADLSPVRHMVIELHPKAYGEEGVDRVLAVLNAKGLRGDPTAPKRKGVVLLDRV
ncbi:MAG: FkbM family methyltransferase [Rhodobacteraceae bacterium]|nr:FkbM family methyltransferase [Paracoccaceae bacterium]